MISPERILQEYVLKIREGSRFDNLIERLNPFLGSLFNLIRSDELNLLEVHNRDVYGAWNHSLRWRNICRCYSDCRHFDWFSANLKLEWSFGFWNCSPSCLNVERFLNRVLRRQRYFYRDVIEYKFLFLLVLHGISVRGKWTCWLFLVAVKGGGSATRDPLAHLYSGLE